MKLDCVQVDAVVGLGFVEFRLLLLELIGKLVEYLNVQ